MMAYSILHLNEVHPLPHPNPPLVKGREPDFSCFPPLQGHKLSTRRIFEIREPDFSCFPPLQGGIKGGNNVIKITANYFSNNLLAMG
ncbi:hypothetical protein NSTCB13_05303 [Nostoc sp. DSM 114160]|jgi:hypothetical protein